MLPQPDPAKSVFKTPSFYSWSLIAAVTLVVGWIFFSRWWQNRAFEIRRGQPVQLCYGVANAKTVTLEPQSNPVWPSYSRCVEVTPAETTTYTLTITGDSGNSKSQSLVVTVR